MRGKVQRVARPVQTRLQNSGVTGPKVTKFFIRHRGVIGGVNACIMHFAILPSDVESQLTE